MRVAELVNHYNHSSSEVSRVNKLTPRPSADIFQTIQISHLPAPLTD